ncbi:MAG: signal peptidase II [Clostridiales bacterium]|nr:signal peptidase II [Clostridiales bacterium]
MPQKNTDVKSEKSGKTDVAGLLVWLLTSVFVVIADQLSKWLVVKYIKPLPDGINVIPGLYDFRYIENTGAAFGILSDHRWIHTAVSTVAITGIVIYLIIKRKDRRSGWINAAAGMIIGGGVGNLIDRYMQGYVVDFIETKFMKFAIFNVADSFVTVGTAILAVCLIAAEIREEKNRQAAKTEPKPKEPENSHV